MARDGVKRCDVLMTSALGRLRAALGPGENGVGGAAQPAVEFAAVGRGRMPIGHRGKMRKRRLVVADAMHVENQAFTVQPPETCPTGLDPDCTIETSPSLRRDPLAPPSPVVALLR